MYVHCTCNILILCVFLMKPLVGYTPIAFTGHFNALESYLSIMSLSINCLSAIIAHFQPLVRYTAGGWHCQPSAGYLTRGRKCQPSAGYLTRGWKCALIDVNAFISFPMAQLMLWKQYCPSVKIFQTVFMSSTMLCISAVVWWLILITKSKKKTLDSTIFDTVCGIATNYS